MIGESRPSSRRNANSAVQLYLAEATGLPDAFNPNVGIDASTNQNSINWTAAGGKRGFSRRKICRFCADKQVLIDYKDPQTLKYFITDRGKIVPRRISGNCAKHQRRLTLGNTLYAHTSVGGPSTVAYQSPGPGTQEGSDPSVNILISLGPPSEYFIMPDLIGQPAELVSSKAKAEGFKIGKLNFRKYAGVEAGVVIQQKPQAGYRLSKSDLILLDVSQ